MDFKTEGGYCLGLRFLSASPRPHTGYYPLHTVNSLFSRVTVVIKGRIVEFIDWASTLRRFVL